VSTNAKVLADSLSPDGIRLTTLEVMMPRVILSEFNTHRTFSRNSASSRAIPVRKIMERVEQSPYIPSVFSLNKPGMNAKEFVRPSDDGWDDCVEWWLNARNNALESAEQGLKSGLHKQVVNRLLEPWLYQTVIVSSTDWDNFFNLRLALDDDGNPLADIAIYESALAMSRMMKSSNPKRLDIDDWHLPLIGDPDKEILGQSEQIAVSVARCARVSYLTHDGVKDYDKDIELYQSLKTNRHMSPFEHIATPTSGDRRVRNFLGWVQAREFVENGLM
jgi:thymidylate synthase ThyX